MSDDALRSLIVSHWLLGTEHVHVIGHTDCGMAKFSNEELHERLQVETGADASGFDFLPFRELDEAIRRSVERIRATPLLPEGFGATGYVYDVRTGRLRVVA